MQTLLTRVLATPNILEAWGKHLGLFPLLSDFTLGSVVNFIKSKQTASY